MGKNFNPLSSIDRCNLDNLYLKSSRIFGAAVHNQWYERSYERRGVSIFSDIAILTLNFNFKFWNI